MAMRKGWDNLSAKQRRAYEVNGITRESYAAGVSLEAARRGRYVTPAGGGREAAQKRAQRAGRTPEQRAQVSERDKARRAARISERRKEFEELSKWSKYHSRSDATDFKQPGIINNPNRITNRDLERSSVIQYLKDYRAFITELEKGWRSPGTAGTGGSRQVIDGFIRKYKQSTVSDFSADRYLSRFQLA